MGRREIDVLGSVRVNHDKGHVPCIGFGAFDNCTGSLIFDGHENYPDPRCECARQVYRRPVILASRWILHRPRWTPEAKSDS